STLSLKEQEAQERKQRERREAKLRQESLEKERNKLDKERAKLRDSRMEAEERDIMKKKKVSTKLQVMCKTAVPGAPQWNRWRRQASRGARQAGAPHEMELLKE
ncbi:hypothetical protein CYMTET_16485, partial [Cymbomonas tetramitiformis]